MLAPITIAAQRRELLTDLKPCLEIPIKGGAIGNTQQQWVQPVQQQLLRHWHFKVSKSPKSQHFANLSHHIDTYETTNVPNSATALRIISTPESFLDDPGCIIDY